MSVKSIGIDRASIAGNIVSLISIVRMGLAVYMSDFKQPSPNQPKKPHYIRGMCLTPWFKAYEATLAPAEIERLDKCLAAAFEGDKNYRLTRWSLQSELRIHRLRLRLQSIR